MTAAPAISTYKSSYGLSSSYYNSPKVAISPAVATVSTLGVSPTYSSYVAPAAKVVSYSSPAITSAYHSGPAVSTYYSANKLAYGAAPSLSTSYVSAPVKQVSYAAPAVTHYTSPYSSSYASNYGSSHGSYGSAYSSAYGSGYGSTYGASKLAYASPAITSTYASPAYTSSYLAANKVAYSAPAVTQYASGYSPSVSTSYISTPIAKQVSYAANPLLGSAYVSGYKSGAYVAPAVATTTLGGAGIIKTAGYTSSLE